MSIHFHILKEEVFMHKLLAYFITVLIVNGCATHSIPPYSAEQTLLVIPKNNENTSLESWFRKYYVVLESLDKDPAFEPVNIWLNNNNEDFVVVNSIPEGSYAIRKIKWKVNSGWRSIKSMDEGYSVFIPVEVVKGKISMPLYRFMIKQRTKGSMAYSSINYENYYKTSIDKITRRIAELEHGSLWTQEYESPNQSLASACSTTQATQSSRKIYNAYIQKALNRILEYYDAPLQDGNKYHGEVTLMLDINGYINEFVLSQPSGHEGLDNAFMNAVKKTNKISLPEDKCAIELLTKQPLELFYNETDMH